MKKGELLILSTECDSDYGFTGSYRVLEDFLFEDIARHVIADYVPPNEWDTKAGPDAVCEWLEKHGYIEEFQCTEVHLGSYGYINVTGVTE